MTYFIPAPGVLEACCNLTGCSPKLKWHGGATLLRRSYSVDDYGDRHANGQHVRVFFSWLYDTLHALLGEEQADSLRFYNELSDNMLRLINDRLLRQRVADFINQYFEEWEELYCNFPSEEAADEYAYSYACERCDDRGNEENGYCEEHCDDYYDYYHGYLSENVECKCEVLDRWWDEGSILDIPPLN